MFGEYALCIHDCTGTVLCCWTPVPWAKKSLLNEGMGSVIGGVLVESDRGMEVGGRPFYTFSVQRAPVNHCWVAHFNSRKFALGCSASLFLAASCSTWNTWSLIKHFHPLRLARQHPDI